MKYSFFARCENNPPMKKIVLCVSFLLISLSAFCDSKESDSTSSCPCLYINGNTKIDYVVVDGVVLTEQSEVRKNDGGLTSINPKMIKEMEIVRSADTNCDCKVILFIRTKKGKKIKRQIPEMLNELGLVWWH